VQTGLGGEREIFVVANQNFESINKNALEFVQGHF